MTDTADGDASVSGLDAIKRRQQQAWADGDFSVIASRQILVAELLCEAVDIHPGQAVLDVATGSGNAALSAARRGGRVTGIDFVPALLARGEERVRAERLSVTFCEGDAEHLPFDGGAFDVVLSTFGVMFAPDQESAARELLRVCRPGGKIGLANWTPGGFSGQMFAVNARYVPPPPGLRPAVSWGTEERLRELLGAGVASLSAQRRHATVRGASEEAWMDGRRKYFGPSRQIFTVLDHAQRVAYERDLLALVRRHNRAEDGTVSIPSEYLEVVAVRK
ncbi:MAG TPA: class I SAM-dependent methyltransferase [bacterium]|nr:class I SAM-dependent methyltransferase [bacterium]